MRRLSLAAVFIAVLASAGGFSGAVVAAAGAQTPASPTTIAPGVRVGNVRVGYLTPEQAEEKVRARFAQRLPVRAGEYRVAVRPEQLGARAYVKPAVARALASPAGAAIPLVVDVRGAALRGWAERLRKRVDREPVDARLSLRNLRPWITPEQPGRSLDLRRGLPALVRALKSGSRAPVRLSVIAAAPSTTRSSFGPVIVIRRESKRLYLYDGMRLQRTFGVATGQASYPTPLGAFSIAVKWRNPWWYPPKSDWAKGQKPVPPGPGNPLGTRWMGLTAPLVGIHGTPDAASIGYSASHGCIRMRIPEAEWLFDHVHVGTPVFIVAA